MRHLMIAAEGGTTSTAMAEEIKTAITSACQSAVDVCKDGIVAVLPIGLSLMAITMGIRLSVRFFRSLAN